jgi:hypothetical protein
MAEMVTSVFGGHKKISNSDIFPQRMLIWIDDHVFGSTNLPAAFTDINRHSPDSACRFQLKAATFSDLKAATVPI